MPALSYQWRQLKVGWHLELQLPCYGCLILPRSCSLGSWLQRTGFDPIIIPFVWLSLFFFCFFFFPCKYVCFQVSLLHPLCEMFVPFKAPWGLSLPFLVLLPYRRRWVEYWLVVMFFPLNNSSEWLFALCTFPQASFSSLPVSPKSIISNSEVHKNLTVFVLVVSWGLNKNVFSCCLGVLVSAMGAPEP